MWDQCVRERESFTRFAPTCKEKERESCAIKRLFSVMYVTLNLLLDICPISSCPFIANQEEEPAGPVQQNRLAAIWANFKLLKFCYFEQYSGKCILGKCCIWHWMDHRVFQFATRGQCIKGKKLDCFEHKFCFKLQCASIVVLLCTAIWWKSKDMVVHWERRIEILSIAFFVWFANAVIEVKQLGYVGYFLKIT